MAHYAIGDVQGCYDQLMALLDKIAFNEREDHLWFAGDLVNRGPKSLEVLRFVKQLPHKRVVLGNHDLHLLAVVAGNTFQDHTMGAVLAADDKTELANWLRHQSLCHYDASLGFVMAHAGVLPQWSIEQAMHYAQEVEAVLQSEHYFDFLTEMYGDEPQTWDESLTGWPRLRFITNVFTRMRFCDAKGRLNLKYKCEVGKQPDDLMPWFAMPNRKAATVNIIFGHWAALMGQIDQYACGQNLYALDTGCVWGNALTALRLEDKTIFQVPGLVT